MKGLKILISIFILWAVMFIAPVSFSGGVSDFDFSPADNVDAEALSVMSKAKAGDAESQYLVGRMFCCSKAVKYDPFKAVIWFGRAAGQNYADAQFMMGYMHSRGRGVNRDKRKALLWYTRAADQGHIGAVFRIGEMYFNGDGVEKDYAKAKLLLEKAAEHGNRGALRLLKEFDEK